MLLMEETDFQPEGSPCSAQRNRITLRSVLPPRLRLTEREATPASHTHHESESLTSKKVTHTPVAGTSGNTEENRYHDDVKLECQLLQDRERQAIVRVPGMYELHAAVQEACKRVRHRGSTNVFDRYAKGAMYMYRMGEDWAPTGDMEAWKRYLGRAPLPVYGMPCRDREKVTKRILATNSASELRWRGRDRRTRLPLDLGYRIIIQC